MPLSVLPRGEREQAVLREELMRLKDDLWVKGKGEEEAKARVAGLEKELQELREDAGKEFQWRKQAVVAKEVALQELQEAQRLQQYTEAQVERRVGDWHAGRAAAGSDGCSREVQRGKWQALAEEVSAEASRREGELQAARAELSRLEAVVRDVAAPRCSHVPTPARVTAPHPRNNSWGILGGGRQWYVMDIPE